MYSEFIGEWQAHFAPRRLLVMHTSEHFARPMRSVRRVWRWLGLRTPSADEEQAKSAGGQGGGALATLARLSCYVGAAFRLGLPPAPPESQRSYTRIPTTKAPPTNAPTATAPNASES